MAISTMFRFRQVLSFLCVLCYASFCDAQSCSYEQKTFPSVSEPLMGIGLGNSLSIHGDYSVQGAFLENSPSTDAGAAYIFQRCGSEWSEIQRIAPAALNSGDRFGNSTAIYGDFIAVGAPFDGTHGTKAGAAYIFQNTDSGWVQTQKIFAPDANGSEWFGNAMSMWGDHLLIGAHYEYVSAGLNGAAYMFKLVDDTFVFEKKLFAPDLGANDKFGYAVDVRDNKAIVGAFENDDFGTDSGSAYIFDFVSDSIGWVFDQKLLPSDGAAEDNYGFSVAISENRALVGAPYNDTLVVNGGSVYVYLFQGDTTWNEVDVLIGPETIVNESYGFTIDQENEMVMVGSLQGVGIEPNTGVVYVYADSADVLLYQQKIFSEFGSHADFFSGSLAFDGRTILAGSRGDDDNGGNAGSAAYFHIDCLPMCTKILSPENASTVDSIVHSIDWAAVTMADGYMLGIGTSPASYDILPLQDVGDVVSYPIELSAQIDYHVEVRPYNVHGTTDYCTDYNFSIDMGLPPDCVDILGPIGTDVGLTDTISWITELDADGYLILLGTADGGTDLLDTLDLGNASWYVPDSLPYNTIVHVTVIPYNSNGLSMACLSSSFQTETASGLQEIAESYDVQLFPNPTNGQEIEIQLRASDNVGLSQLRDHLTLHSIRGEHIDYQIEGIALNGNRAHVRLSFDLSPGIYLIGLRSSAIRKKLVVE